MPREAFVNCASNFLVCMRRTVVNPMSVHIKARITLPAIIHSFIGAKHPILATGVHSVSFLD